MYIVATVSSKGRVTLPLTVRKRLGVDIGDMLSFELEGDLVVVRKARSIEDYLSTLPPLGISKEKIATAIAHDDNR